MSKIRVRFAPSPTGPLHIGGCPLRAFLIIYLQKKIKVILLSGWRIPIETVRPGESEENIIAALKWLAIDWNEGIGVGGEFGPYRQMERLSTYQDAVNQLIEGGYAYYCYCSEEELEAERQALIAKGETPGYQGHCRNLSDSERKAKEEAGIKPVIRFKVPDNVELSIDDLVRGKVIFNSNEIAGRLCNR